MSKQFPIIFRKPKIVMVDDDKDFLYSTEEHVKKHGYNVIAFSDPELALEYCQMHMHQDINIMDEVIDNSILDETNYKFDFQHLLNEFLKPQELLFLIVDHRMPKIDGIELCKKLNDFPVKLLLTGVPDLNIAVKNLTTNVINGFQPKSSENKNAELLEHIITFTRRYYFQNSKSLIKSKKFAHFQSKAFITIIENALKQIDATDYVVISSSGTCLIKGYQKNYILVIHSDESLSEFYKFYEDIPELQHLISSAKNNKLIPFFGICKEPESIEIDEWEKSFYTSTVTDGFHWCLLDE